jgi:hypothetical protein
LSRISRSTVQRATATHLAVQLPPDLASAIDLQVGSMDSLDLIDQDGIALGSLRHERRVAHCAAWRQ